MALERDRNVMVGSDTFAEECYDYLDESEDVLEEKLRVSLGGGRGGTALKRNCRLVEGYCPQEKLRVSLGGGVVRPSKETVG